MQVLEDRPAIETPTGILDVDAHEMTPSHLWGDVFGEAAGRIAAYAEPVLKRTGANDFYNPDVSSDSEPINEDTIWNIRGVRAPGAFDMARRLRVMDLMGVSKQLLFPSYAIFANHFIAGDMYMLRERYGLSLPEDEIRSLGVAGLAEYNEWVVANSAIDPDRVRPVAYVHAGDSVDDLVRRTTELLDCGVRAICVPMTVPPGGQSPAHPDLDPFWSLLVDRRAVLTMHVGDITGFTASTQWVKAPAFKTGKVESHELGSEPYSFATLHYAISNYLTCMVLGGVFERHPDLRVGAIELGASWLAPLATNLDMWAKEVYATRLKPFISRLPSEYLATNVRVTPFNNIEPIGQILEQNPSLVSSFCYSTDYPHIEGGMDSKSRMLDKVAHLGQDVVDRFFVQNAELLFPD